MGLSHHDFPVIPLEGPDDPFRKAFDERWDRERNDTRVACAQLSERIDKIREECFGPGWGHIDHGEVI
jgi:hypothetical protein